MYRRLFLFAAIVSAFALLIAVPTVSAQRGRKFKAPLPTARIEVTVVRADDSKPVENASVIFHTIKEQGSMELKTNEEGKTIIDVLPIGDTMLLQVIGKGYQTFGQEYPIKQAKMAVEVRLKRPVSQYSIYKNNPSGKKDDNKDQKKSPDPQPKPQE
ncbi:MAG: carboxypeptidase-like regulatory domain-containing protein [Acidobacteriota bacterium]